jgi:hypothetical protein
MHEFTKAFRCLPGANLISRLNVVAIEFAGTLLNVRKSGM